MLSSLSGSVQLTLWYAFFLPAPLPARYEKQFDTENNGTPPYLSTPESLTQLSKGGFEINTLLCSTKWVFATRLACLWLQL